MSETIEESLKQDLGDGLGEALSGESDWQRLEHYNGEAILEYSHSLHSYTTVENGVRTIIPGSTRVCAMADKSGPLTQWAANMTVEWAISHLPIRAHDAGDLRQLVADGYQHCKEKIPWLDADIKTSRYMTIDTRELAILLNEARFNYRAISKTATDIGHMAHEALEHRIKAQIANAGTDQVTEVALPADEKACNCIKAALQWFALHKFRPVFSEKKLYSRKYGYAGTCDWLAYVTGCGDHACCPFDGEALVLGDFKSSRALYDEYFLQLASYKQAIEEEFPELRIVACMLLRLGKEDGEFEVRTSTAEQFESDLDGFLGLLQTYHWQAQRDLNKKFEKELAKVAKKEEEAHLKIEERVAKVLAKAAAKAEKDAALLEGLEGKALVRAQAKLEREKIKAEAALAISLAKARSPQKRTPTKRAVVRKPVEAFEEIPMEEPGEAQTVNESNLIPIEGEEAA